MDLAMPQGVRTEPAPTTRRTMDISWLCVVGAGAALLHVLPLTSLCSELACTECARLISSSKLREPSICPFILSNASLYLY